MDVIKYTFMYHLNVGTFSELDKNIYIYWRGELKVWKIFRFDSRKWFVDAKWTKESVFLDVEKINCTSNDYHPAIHWSLNFNRVEDPLKSNEAIIPRLRKFIKRSTVNFGFWITFILVYNPLQSCHSLFYQ